MAILSLRWAMYKTPEHGGSSAYSCATEYLSELSTPLHGPLRLPVMIDRLSQRANKVNRPA
jgi:hypothetical protein